MAIFITLILRDDPDFGHCNCFSKSQNTSSKSNIEMNAGKCKCCHYSSIDV